FCSISLSPSALFTLSLHDALPIYPYAASTPHVNKRANCDIVADFHILGFVNTNRHIHGNVLSTRLEPADQTSPLRVLKNNEQSIDRKSTRLNSSHLVISYAVFCLK